MTRNRIKTILPRVALLAGLLCQVASAQSSPDRFPLAGDWDGTLVIDGSASHLVLHMGTTPEGKMTALMDNVGDEITGVPGIGGSFDGSRLILRFPYWKPNSNRDLEEKAATYEATVNEATSEMTGIWKQEGSWPLTLKRMTWQAKVPKAAPPTIFDGDWAGVEDEGQGLKIHFALHIHNTEDGLRVLIDCPEEKFKGALASKVSYDQDSRQITITFFKDVIFTGKMSADGKALHTSMTEPGYHFLIHFDRVTPNDTKLN